MKCARCGDREIDVLYFQVADLWICIPCHVAILLEWDRKRTEYAELSSS
jgi:hypothetical protein